MKRKRKKNEFPLETDLSRIKPQRFRYFFLYSFGEIPTYLLKALLNEDFELKPTL